MKELKLQVNFAFYCVIGIIAFSIYIISLSLSGGSLSVLFKGQMALALIVIVIAAINFTLAITGQRHVLFCNNGLSYVNVFGTQKYIPAETITNVKVQTKLAVKVTTVSTELNTIYLVGFKPAKDQKLKLKQLGYLA
ncbi:hypothetical protein CWB96_17970 [Pseudoalteromonas citrea]|uniref:PH domain-containing protein n=1 Tax=Pseudoalteromonas citrea TaxID=43655 RepID=A0A5S3XK23_9GAMM|nr:MULTISPECIES: hypothetical protein [Pseudoalteromonas]RJE76518.1 hypothetical protein BGP78_12890 [Pseudoalteromonas sp. MSK9-3]TMP41283.1 hypothetical protein CWB97_15030 [Pseudoalteromonas citrea]TMP55127.1 hypothetical protein CWB96_17970 [Pseudoalteromonas citrea]